MLRNIGLYCGLFFLSLIFFALGQTRDGERRTGRSRERGLELLDFDVPKADASAVVLEHDVSGG